MCKQSVNQPLRYRAGYFVVVVLLGGNTVRTLKHANVAPVRSFTRWQLHLPFLTFISLQRSTLRPSSG